VRQRVRQRGEAEGHFPYFFHFFFVHPALFVKIPKHQSTIIDSNPHISYNEGGGKR
jgi:hypothetical protein